MVCQQILDVMSEAWTAKRPWSNHYHAKREGRYAAAIMATRWGLDQDLAERMLGAWLINEVIEVSIADHKAKTRGLRVLRGLQDGSPETARTKWYDN
jgi:hypothetical protein